jgi:hypothetical protein
MTLQSENKGHGWAYNLPLHMGLVAAVTFILIVVAWKFVW